MLKEALKNVLRRAVLYRRRKKTFSSFVKHDRELVKSHPEWIGLTSSERASLKDKNHWAYIAFKNMRGRLDEGHVSDALYQMKLLPILNAVNYFGMDRNIRARNLFCNKNYFELMLRYLPMPEIVLHHINGEFLSSDWQILTEGSALNILNEHERLVFKPAAGTGHGTHVSLVERKDFREALQKYAKYDNGGGGLYCTKGSEAA